MCGACECMCVCVQLEIVTEGVRKGGECWQLFSILRIVIVFFPSIGALAGPIIVEPHVTAVWGKNVSLKCLIEVNETITQISWEKIHGKSSQTVAVHHPQYGFSVQGEYQGRVLFKNYSLNDATITLHNIGFSDSGKYICKAVTFPLGNAQSSTTVTVLGRYAWIMYFGDTGEDYNKNILKKLKWLKFDLTLSLK